MPGLMTLRATLRRTGSVCSAMKTMPMPPSPICCSSLYGPIDRAGPLAGGRPVDGGRAGAAVGGRRLQEARRPGRGPPSSASTRCPQAGVAGAGLVEVTRPARPASAISRASRKMVFASGVGSVMVELRRVGLSPCSAESGRRGCHDENSAGRVGRVARRVECVVAARPGRRPSAGRRCRARCRGRRRPRSTVSPAK